MKLKRIILLLLTVMFSFSYGEVFAKDGNSLKKALKNKFLIGVSVNTHQSSGKDVAAVEIVKKNFNSIVAENCMKSSVIHPKENKYNFAQADEFVSFGESNQMAIIYYIPAFDTAFIAFHDGSDMVFHPFLQDFRRNIIPVLIYAKPRSQL